MAITIREARDESLYQCDVEELSAYFVQRQINDYCVSTGGIG